MPITSTLGTAAASTSTRSIRVYLTITISTRVNIVRERVTNMAKDVQAIDRQFNKFKDSLSKIKDKLAFLRRSVITLVYNAGLPDIE